MAQNAVIDPSSLPSRKLDLVVLGDLGVGKSSIVLRVRSIAYLSSCFLACPCSVEMCNCLFDSNHSILTSNGGQLPHPTVYH